MKKKIVNNMIAILKNTIFLLCVVIPAIVMCCLPYKIATHYIDITKPAIENGYLNTILVCLSILWILCLPIVGGFIMVFIDKVGLYPVKQEEIK